MSAKEDKRISFHMLDKKDYGRIGYKTINKATGREVGRDRIVKGYEYESGQFVVMTDKDFERANPKKTRTIDIEDFVCLEEVDPVLFEQPYYLVPGKGGEKGYMLLKQVMEETGKVAIGTFVMREKQKLVAILVRGDFLMIETLRYAHEVITVKEAKAVHNKIDKVKVSKKELDMAESLVRGMTTKWNPEKYKDTYYDDVMRLIKAKVKGGKAVEAFETEEADTEPKAKVLDLMPLLKQSLEKKKGGHAHRKPAKKGRGSHGAAHV
jgi:DNA end-binding protein Ku